MQNIGSYFLDEITFRKHLLVPQYCVIFRQQFGMKFMASAFFMRTRMMFSVGVLIWHAAEQCSH